MHPIRDITTLNSRGSKRLPRIQRQLGVENAALYRELFKKQFETITSIDVIDKEYAFPLDEFEFQHHVSEKKLVDFGDP
jgi:hypothetical protein